MGKQTVKDIRHCAHLDLNTRRFVLLYFEAAHHQASVRSYW